MVWYSNGQFMCFTRPTFPPCPPIIPLPIPLHFQHNGKKPFWRSILDAMDPACYKVVKFHILASVIQIPTVYNYFLTAKCFFCCELYFSNNNIEILKLVVNKYSPYFYLLPCKKISLKKCSPNQTRPIVHPSILELDGQKF